MSGATSITGLNPLENSNCPEAVKELEIKSKSKEA